VFGRPLIMMPGQDVLAQVDWLAVDRERDVTED